MITVFGFEFALPRQLMFLSGEWGSFLGTIIASLILGVILYVFVFVILNFWFRKTDTEVDDVILGVSRWPFIIFSVLFGLERSIEVWGTENAAGWTEKWLWALIAIVVTWWVSKLFKEVAVYELKNFAIQSEAAWDDVLVPIIEQFVPPIVWIIGIIVFLQTLGINLTGFYVAIGGTAFILGFALQDVLSNLFSGLVLLLDTPFQFGDVILLEDGTVAVINDIGLRVTHLYNTQNHSDIFMPNSTLGSMNIVNITRPTTDLEESITVGVGYASDIQKVSEILESIIKGHPDVLGDIEEKLNALDEFQEFTEKKKKTARKRLETEKRVNEVLEKLEEELKEFVATASKLEQGGLDKDEVNTIREHYYKILATIGLKPVKKTRGRLTRPKWELEDENAESSLFELIREWYKAWLKDPDLVEEDAEALPIEWEQKIEKMTLKAKKLFDYVINPVGHERRLDDYAEAFNNWIKQNFKRSRVLWKDPDIRLSNFGDSSLDFEISFYVDNINLEHWERASRVKDELRREIKRRFDEEGIEMPFPQTDIWFRSALETEVAASE